MQNLRSVGKSLLEQIEEISNSDLSNEIDSNFILFKIKKQNG